MVYLILLHVPAVQFNRHQRVVLHTPNVQFTNSCVCRVKRNNIKFVLKAHKQISNVLNLKKNATCCYWA